MCPRCTGLVVEVELLDAEANFMARRCPACGWIGGEALLDFHHALSITPEPYPDRELPVYVPPDPRRRQHGRPP